MKETRVCPHCNAPHLRCHTVRVATHGTGYEYRCDSCGYEMSAPGMPRLMVWIAFTAVVFVSYVSGVVTAKIPLWNGTFFVATGVNLFAVSVAVSMVRNRIRLLRQPLATGARAWVPGR